VPASPARLRVAVASVLAAVCAVVLSGCGAGLEAFTSRPYDPSVGSVAVIGSMHVNDVVVVTDGNIPDLMTTVVNQGSAPDTLQTVQVSDSTSVSLPTAGVDVQPTNFVTFGPGSDDRLLIDGLTAGLGRLVTVTYFFRVAGRVQVTAMVTTPGNLFAGS